MVVFTIKKPVFERIIFLKPLFVEEPYSHFVALANHGIELMEMEDAVGIAACFLQRGFGIAPLAVVLTDDDAYLGVGPAPKE